MTALSRERNMGTHPETVLEEKLRRAKALSKAAVDELERLALADNWAAMELLDLLETSIAEACQAFERVSTVAAGDAA